MKTELDIVDEIERLIRKYSGSDWHDPQDWLDGLNAYYPAPDGTYMSVGSISSLRLNQRHEQKSARRKSIRKEIEHKAMLERRGKRETKAALEFNRLDDRISMLEELAKQMPDRKEEFHKKIAEAEQEQMKLAPTLLRGKYIKKGK